MRFHETPGSPLAEFLRISAPFLVGMIASAWAVGAYDEPASDSFVKKSSLALLLGLSLSLALRSFQRQVLPSVQFLLPSLLFFSVLTAVFKGIWWWRFRSQQKSN